MRLLFCCPRLYDCCSRLLAHICSSIGLFSPPAKVSFCLLSSLFNACYSQYRVLCTLHSVHPLKNGFKKKIWGGGWKYSQKSLNYAYKTSFGLCSMLSEHCSPPPKCLSLSVLPLHSQLPSSNGQYTKSMHCSLLNALHLPMRGLIGLNS